MKTKLLSILSGISLITSLFLGGISVGAEQPADASQMSKVEFAEYCDRLNAQKGRQRSAGLTDEEVTKLLYNYSFSTGDTKQSYEKQLNDAGFYIYTSSENSISTRSTSNKVELEACSIVYGSDKNWRIYGGGSWLSYLGYKHDLPGFAWFPSVGDKKNVGGLDAVGITIVNQSGTTPDLVRAFAYIHDDHGHEEYYYNAANENHKDGVIFEYQDYQRCLTSGFTYTSSYMGHGFSATAIYDSSFAKWNGQCRPMYTHTWDKGNISGITVGNSGISVSVNNKDYGWTSYGTKTVSF